MDQKKMTPHSKKILIGCAVVLIVGGFLLYGVYWIMFDAESPLNRESAFASVYQWARLSPVPDNVTNVSIETRGAMFTREFTLEFDAPEKDISLWLSASPGTQEVIPEAISEGGTRYKIKPGGGAAYAEVFVSSEGTHVRVHTYWS